MSWNWNFDIAPEFTSQKCVRGGCVSSSTGARAQIGSKVWLGISFVRHRPKIEFPNITVFPHTINHMAIVCHLEHLKRNPAGCLECFAQVFALSRQHGDPKAYLQSFNPRPSVLEQTTGLAAF